RVAARARPLRLRRGVGADQTGVRAVDGRPRETNRPPDSHRSGLPERTTGAMTTTITASELGQQIRRKIMAELHALQVFINDAKARKDATALDQLEEYERELFDSLQSMQEHH